MEEIGTCRNRAVLSLGESLLRRRGLDHAISVYTCIDYCVRQAVVHHKTIHQRFAYHNFIKYHSIIISVVDHYIFCLHYNHEPNIPRLHVHVACWVLQYVVEQKFLQKILKHWLDMYTSRSPIRKTPPPEMSLTHLSGFVQNTTVSRKNGCSLPVTILFK